MDGDTLTTFALDVLAIIDRRDISRSGEEEETSLPLLDLRENGSILEP